MLSRPLSDIIREIYSEGDTTDMRAPMGTASPPLTWTIRPLFVTDLDAALELSRQAGWEDVYADWKRLLDWQPDGCFAAVLDDRLIGTVTTIRYGTELAWIGYMLVDVAHRRRGVGRSLMRVALSKLAEHGMARVMLDGSALGRPLYEKSGFRPLYAVDEWTGVPSLPHAHRPRLTVDHLPAVAAYDLPRFGADRGRVLFRLAAEFPDLARVDLDGDGAVRGYILGCRRERAITIGPWLHEDARGAAQLLGSVLGSCGGQPLQVRVPEVNAAAGEILERAGLRRTGADTRMILGDAEPPGQPEAVYASPDY